MGANITIEELAFGDVRFELLAAAAGLADRDHAAGKLGRLWLICTETQHYTVSLALVRTVLGPGGVDALVAAELGELVDAHQPTEYVAAASRRAPPPASPDEPVMRLAGTIGRIEWYGRNRANASAGGRAKAARGRRKAVDNRVDNVSASCEIDATTSSEGTLVHSLEAATRLATGNAGGHATRQRDVSQRVDNLPGGMPGGMPGGLPSDQRSQIQISDQIPEGGPSIDEVCARLAALRSRVATSSGGAAGAVTRTERAELVELLASSTATDDQLDRAFGMLEASAAARGGPPATVDALRRLLAVQGRAAPRRATLRVVAEEQEVGS